MQRSDNKNHLFLSKSTRLMRAVCKSHGIHLLAPNLSYRRDENSFPMQLCKGRRMSRTAIPARQETPISIQSRAVTATACSGPAHKKCRKIVTFKGKDKVFLGLVSGKTRDTMGQKQPAMDQHTRPCEEYDGFSTC